MSNFASWLETFLSEKGIDGETVLAVEGPSGPNFIPVDCLVAAIIGAPANEQAGIKSTIVKIDFINGDVLHFFRHLARAIAL